MPQTPMRTASLLLALAACTTPVDTDEQAVLTCPEVAPFHSPGDWRPVGVYAGTWTCIEGCDAPAPALAKATSLTVGKEAASWTGEGGIFLAGPVEPVGVNCWRMEPVVGAWCRSALDVCGVTDHTGERFVVAGATWTNATTGDQQRWYFAGP